MKLQKNPTFLDKTSSWRVVPENGLCCGPFCYTKQEAVAEWLRNVAAEVTRGACSVELIMAVLGLEEIETTEL